MARKINKASYLHTGKAFIVLMFESFDCIHWRWKNCTTALQCMYCGHYLTPTIILEAIASHYLWIRHAFIGMTCSLNDINIFERSLVFSVLTNGQAPLINLIVNGHNYHMGYYLEDNIFHSWVTFVKTIQLQ